MAKFGLMAIAIVPMLAACSAELFPAFDARVDQAPMSADSRRALSTFFNKPDAKAFVFSEETGENWHAWGYSTIDEAEAVSLAKCEELTSTRCTTFALNNKIVWQSAGQSPAANTTAPAQAKATTSVNMRSGPSTSFTVAGVLAAGESVTVTGNDGVWQAIRRADGSVGYVHGDYLSAAVSQQPAANSNRLDGEELRALRNRAQAGDVDAQFDLGNRYLHAFGVSKDLFEAREWFTLAADQGHVLASYELGLIYEKGLGVEPSSGEARRWFRQAADAGHSPSQDKLR